MRAIYAVLLLLFTLTLIAFYPGIVTTDSINQYEMALSHAYTDHHPPVMSWWWGVLLMLSPLAIPMLCFHLLMFYGALAILAGSLYPLNRKAAWAVVLLALVPHVLCIVGVIWKDVGMALSFLLAAAWLTRVTIQGWRYKYMESLAIGIILFYAVSIKYQAQFALPAILLWWVWLWEVQSKARLLCYAALLWCGIVGSSQQLTYHMIGGKEGQMQSWQQVKMCDLAMLSKHIDTDPFPLYVQHFEHYSLSRIKNEPMFELVVPLFGANPPMVPLTKDPAQLEELMAAWRHAIWTYLGLYFKDRFRIWGRMLDSKYAIAKTVENPYGFVQPNNILSQGLRDYLSLGWHTPFKTLSCVIPFSLWLLYQAYRHWHKERRLAVAILAMQGAAWSLLSVLLFLSMASQYRYGYLAVLMIVFALPIGMAMRDRQRNVLN